MAKQGYTSKRATKRINKRELIAQEARERKQTLKPEEAAFIGERIKPGVSRGEAARRCKLGFIPRRPLVEQTIRKIIREDLGSRVLSAERVIKEVERMALVDPANFYDDNGNFLPVHMMDEDTRRAVVYAESEAIYDGIGQARELIGFAHKVKTEKGKHLEMLMKHFGLLEGTGAKSGDRIKELLAAWKAGPVDKK